MLLENKNIIKYNAQHKIMRWDGLNKNQINKSLKLIKKCKSEKFDSISKTDWKIDKNEKREYFDYLWKECLEPFKESFSNLWGGRKLILQYTKTLIILSGLLVMMAQRMERMISF